MLRDALIERFPALRKVGLEPFVVGGAVRDLLLGRDPADVDVACIDPLAAARRLSPRVIRLGGAEHLSAWRVALDGHIYDFAELLDHDIVADLARRDFTVNAMAVRLGDGELLDPHGGRRDLESRTIRMVRRENFADDPLRVLKGVRIAVTLGFTIDEETLDAMREHAPLIVNVAAERVTYELSLILGAGAFRKATALLQSTRLDAALGLRVQPFLADDVPLGAALALLVPSPEEFAERWKWSVDLLRQVLTLQSLAERHDLVALYDAGERVAAQLPPMLRALGRDDSVQMPDFTTKWLLTGEEITALTAIGPGKELGRIKRALLEAQLRGEVRSRAEAEEFVRATASA